MDVLRTLNHYRTTLIAFLLLGLAGALLSLSAIRPLYRAEAIVLIAPTELAGDLDLVRDVEFGDANSLIESQVRILASRSLAADIVRSVDLDNWSAESLSLIHI